MVASTVRLPNVRKMFLPDPGFTLVEGDLKRADAQVVAWESDDRILKQMFREGIDIHSENAKIIFHLKSSSVSADQRQKAKIGVHAVNYGCRARTLAKNLGILVSDAEAFTQSWFNAHPLIHSWHNRVEMDMLSKREIRNVFGFRYKFLDRVSNALPEALAWIGQSTTAITINKALLNIENGVPSAQLLLQIHDSLLMQVPSSDCPEIYPTILKAMLVRIPYLDPLIIDVDLKSSSKSWGDVEEIATPSIASVASEAKHGSEAIGLDHRLHAIHAALRGA